MLPNPFLGVSLHTGVDDGGGINGYKKRTRENIVSLSKIFDLEGCLEEVRMGANKHIS